MTVNYKLLGVPYIVASSAATGMATTGDTNENTLATITIPAGAMGANGIVRVTTSFSYSSSATSRTARIKFGGTTYQSTNVANTGSAKYQTLIANRGATNSQSGSNISGIYSTSSGAAVTSSVDTTAAVTILITGQNGLGSDTITLESYFVEVIYKA